MESSGNKPEMDSVEHRERAPRNNSASAIDADTVKHGDRALAIIGDERVSLTEEDV